MAIIKEEKQNLNTIQFEKVDVETPIVEALDVVAENPTPFLKQETNGNLVVMGDPTAIQPPKEDEFDFTLMLPMNEFDINEWTTVIKSNEDWFMVALKATQEKITPFNRTFLSSVAVDYLALFFIDREGDGNFEMLTGADLANATLRYFRQDDLIENSKYFVGKLLGLEQEYIPYILDTEVVTLAVELVLRNPSLINEAYFAVKP